MQINEENVVGSSSGQVQNELNDKRAISKTLIPNSLRALQEIASMIEATDSQLSDIKYHTEKIEEIYDQLYDVIDLDVRQGCRG